MRALLAITVLTLLVPLSAAAQVESNFYSGGGVRIGWSNTACAAGIAGAIRYNSGSGGSVDLCNGLTWINVGSGSATPAGADTQIQFNSGGAFGASPAMVWDNANGTLAITGGSSDGLYLGEEGGSTAVVVGVYDDLSLSTLGNAAGAILFNVDSNGDLTGEEAMRINSIGIGIGTTSPGALTHINATSTTGNTVLEALRLSHEDTNSGGAANMGASMTFNLETATNNTFAEAGRIETVWLDPTANSKDSEMRFYVMGQNTSGATPALVASLWKDTETTFQLTGDWITWDSNTSNGVTFQKTGAEFLGVANTNAITLGGAFTASADAVTIQGVASQTGDYFNITSDGGAAGGILTVDSAGEVGIGTTSPSGILTISGNNQDIHHYSFSSSASSKADYDFFWARGTEASPTAALTDDYAGTIRFNARDNSGAYDTIGQVGAYVTTGNAATIEGYTFMGINRQFRFLSNGRIEYHESNNDPEFYSHSSVDSASGVDLKLYRSRGTETVPSIVQSGDKAGGLRFGGYDSVNYEDIAAIYGVVDGTPGSNDMPGRLEFHTVPDGTANAVERMRINSAGNVGIGTSTPQSALHVPDGKYAQLEDNNAGPPPAGDCDADAERGRMSIDTSNNRLYVCNGATRGWDYVALTD